MTQPPPTCHKTVPTPATRSRVEAAYLRWLRRHRPGLLWRPADPIEHDPAGKRGRGTG